MNKLSVDNLDVQPNITNQGLRVNSSGATALQSRRFRFRRLAIWSLSFASVLVSLPCWAESELPPVLEPEPEVHAVRALLELQAVFLLGVIYYGATGNSDSGFSINYDWDVFRRKISGQSFDADKNQFTTNFVGHPLGGAGYYLAARSNGLSALTSSAVSIAGSVVWELFGEPKEEISMNDTIVTPMAGIAIGETTFRLSNFFNRGAPTWFNRTVGVVLGPFTALNQWVDGTQPVRVAEGYPQDVWHQMYTSLALLQVHERTSRQFIPQPEVELQAHMRTEDVPLPTKPTALHSDTFTNGNAAHLGINVAFAGEHLSRVEVDCQSVLFGVNYAAARGAEDAESGYLGLGMGFKYTGRRYDRAHQASLNRWSSTQPLHVATGHHAKRGAWTLDAWAAVGPAFAGIDALALDLEHQDANFPEVTRNHGYYFGWGVFAQTLVELRRDALSLRVSTLNESAYSTRAPGEAPVPSMSDLHQHIAAAIGYRIPQTETQLQLFGARRLRQSHVLDARSNYEEFTTGLQLVTQTH